MNSTSRYLLDREKEFYKERENTLKNISSQRVADSPMLFATRQTATDFLTRVELFNMIRNVSGHIVECGVNKGNSLMQYAHMSSIFEPYAINRSIVGFDTFDGFRSINSEKDPKDVTEKTFSDVNSLDVLNSAIKLYDMNRAAPHFGRIELVQGDAVKTIPEYVKATKHLTISMLYIDFDLYEPTKVALQHLYPLVCKGGVVVFDEFNYKHYAGETEAFQEMIGADKVRLQRFSYSPFIAYFVKE